MGNKKLLKLENLKSNDMKKNILLVFIVFVCSFGYAQDACYNIYKGALQEYNSGNYTEAQRKLVIVAQTCGDYSAVWEKLKDCNKKLAEQQQQQTQKIAKLTDDNKELVRQKKAAEQEWEIEKSNLRQNVSAEAGKIARLDNDISNLNAQIKSQNAKIDQLRDSIVGLQKEKKLLMEKLSAEENTEPCVFKCCICKLKMKHQERQLKKEQNN